jgi:ferredoxin-NADP reductase
MAPFQTFTARLTCSTALSHFTKHLEFEIKDVSRFGFVAGQWLSFKTTKADGEEITRAYSIASPPSENNAFALCLNRVQDGYMSNFLCDMKPGDEISCQGPFGDFILRPPMRDTLFIATGTGIAPIRSMLHSMYAPHADGREGSSSIDEREVSLIFGNRTEKDIYYDNEFQRLAAEHKNFHYLPTLSRGSKQWTDARGYVQEHVASIAKGRSDMHAYICGLDKMVRANRELLKLLGWDRKSIVYEKYD